MPRRDDGDLVFSDRLLRVGGERIVASLMRRLLHEGGTEDALVLRNRQRVRGALWSPALHNGFAPVVTEASLRLWRKASAGLVAHQRWNTDDARHVGARRQARKVVRDWVPSIEVEAGDDMFFALAGAVVVSRSSSVVLADAFAGRLGAASLTFALRHLRGGHEQVALLLQQTLASPKVRLLEAWRDGHAIVMRDAIQQALALARDVDAFVARAHGMHDVVRAVFEATEQAGRPDLLHWMMSYALALHAAFDVDGDPRDVVDRRLQATSMKERQRGLDGVTRLFDVVEWLAERRVWAQEQTYGTAHYEPAQAFLSTWDDHRGFADAWPRLQLMSDRSRGRLG